MKGIQWVGGQVTFAFVKQQVSEAMKVLQKLQQNRNIMGSADQRQCLCIMWSVNHKGWIWGNTDKCKRHQQHVKKGIWGRGVTQNSVASWGTSELRRMSWSREMVPNFMSRWPRSVTADRSVTDRGRSEHIGGRLWLTISFRGNLCGLLGVDSGAWIQQPQSSKLSGFPGIYFKPVPSGRARCPHWTGQLLLGSVQVLTEWKQRSQATEESPRTERDEYLAAGKSQEEASLIEL